MHLFPSVLAIALSGSFFAIGTYASSQERNPLNYISAVDAAEIRTPSNRVHALSAFDLVFDLHAGQQQIKLTLEPNHDIIPDGAMVQYLAPDGSVARTETINRHDHRVYKGSTRLQSAEGSWDRVGWSRIVVRRDGRDPLFEGAFTIMGDHHHIQLRSNYMQTKHSLDPEIDSTESDLMIVFRDSDISDDASSELRRSEDSRLACPADRLVFNTKADHPIYTAATQQKLGYWGSMSPKSLFGKRQLDTAGIPSGGNTGGVNLRSTIGQTNGCPSTRKVALVGVATDCGYTASFDSTDTARQNVITQMNSASDLYERAFNITLGLRNLTISDANCPGSPQATAPWNIPCAGDVTIQDRLNLFSAWRGTKQDTNSHWTLLTTCNTGSAVGLAWLGQTCVSQVSTSQDASGANETTTGANVVAKTSTEWQVIAHETGHTFGAVHDCTSNTCQDGRTVNAQQCCPLSSSTCDASERFLMNPSTGRGITEFSPCSIGNICSALARNGIKSDCFSANRGITTITGNQCGNGIVEEGEDCDCGGDESCAGNDCCDARTCRFKDNAVCDDSNEECCSNCQFASASTVCRPSTGQCDPVETCTGTAATCPVDTTAPDGQACGNGTEGLACASGQCTSRNLQCKTLMGSFTQNNSTYACDTSNCQLSCASPEFGPNSCFGMQQNFLDGTPCYGGGKCSNGQCEGSNVAKEIGSWISRHKPIVIGIASAIGALILFSILGCVWRCCTRRKKSKRKVVPPVWPQQNWSQTPMRGVPGYSGHSRDASHYWQVPPPPAYAGRPTVRYA
ncbi:MAG: hypothetical protein M1817_002664 [Caeruleum heppii]|nr:MAG: hypothetical protein M1817_002664 [Caeruleum heppii]